MQSFSFIATFVFREPPVALIPLAGPPIWYNVHGRMSCLRIHVIIVIWVYMDRKA